MVELATRIKQEVETRYPVKYCCGIDVCCDSYLQIHNSVIKAQKALKTSLRSPQKGIRLYESISMEIFQSELSSNIKREYILRIFKGCSPGEIRQWINILNYLGKNQRWGKIEGKYAFHLLSISTHF